RFATARSCHSIRSCRPSRGMVVSVEDVRQKLHSGLDVMRYGRFIQIEARGDLAARQSVNTRKQDRLAAPGRKLFNRLPQMAQFIAGNYNSIWRGRLSGQAQLFEIRNSVHRHNAFAPDAIDHDVVGYREDE